MLNALADRLPDLRKVSLQWEDDDLSDDDGIHCLQTAPNLVQVAVSNINHFVPVDLPTSQLTRYSLDAAWDVHWGILNLATNLTTAYVNIDFDFEEEWPPVVEPVSLIHLRRLHASHLQILDYLNLPALEAAAIRIDTFEDEEHFVPNLMSLARRSSCELKSVRLIGSPTAPVIAQLFRECATIEDLRLMFAGDATNDWKDIKKIMTVLTPLLSSTDSQTLKTLRFLILGKNRLNPADVDVFLSMAELRARNAEYAAFDYLEWLVERPGRASNLMYEGLESLKDDLSYHFSEGAQLQDLWREWRFRS
uniref:F-box domain-containing protein n=1 Tax=Mycena chlorophos TaxID=658473 RepID=A0ABQ0LY57_MYCCL|nr:predicted protein [Mycena chlorophos]